MAITISAADIDAAVSLIQSPKLTTAIAALKAAKTAKFGDIQLDAIGIEDWLDLGAEVPGLSDLGDISALMKVGMVLYSISSPQPGGGLFGAFAASLSGKQATVANADGSDLSQ